MEIIWQFGETFVASGQTEDATTILAAKLTTIRSRACLNEVGIQDVCSTYQIFHIIDIKRVFGKGFIFMPESCLDFCFFLPGFIKTFCIPQISNQTQIVILAVWKFIIIVKLVNLSQALNSEIHLLAAVITASLLAKNLYRGGRNARSIFLPFIELCSINRANALDRSQIESAAKRIGIFLVSG